MQAAEHAEARPMRHPRFCHVRPAAVRWLARMPRSGCRAPDAALRMLRRAQDAVLRMPVTGAGRPPVGPGLHGGLREGCGCHPAGPFRRCLSLSRLPAAAGGWTADCCMVRRRHPSSRSSGWPLVPSVGVPRLPWRAGVLRFRHLSRGPCRPSQTAGAGGVMPPGAGATERRVTQQPAAMSLPGCRNPLHMSRKARPM